eukprot:CAMPEP_0113956126 /NCGR_PEP_ID=MMETSP0011_2-20120614/1857_1 /TAXON_ID=101924 /ORGANISM="Rhodosorus marinus" /LENGTH=78 /DNA_ID=CAMNT_0000966175 /DNA_START=142 /DNA_END=378 /DNA_ORIENTATION=+ /assembly_acc=CAM_ASM_000156
MKSGSTLESSGSSDKQSKTSRTGSEGKMKNGFMSKFARLLLGTGSSSGSDRDHELSRAFEYEPFQLKPAGQREREMER